MSTLVIMERLQANFSEITSIKRAFKYAPTLPIDDSDLPAIYPLKIGRMSQPTPRESAGQYIIERTYTYRECVKEALKATTDNANDGSYIIALTDALIDDVTDYLMQHPRLNTTTLADLPLLKMDVTVQDNGSDIKLGPGGVQYVIIDYNLIIQERRFPTNKRLS